MGEGVRPGVGPWARRPVVFVVVRFVTSPRAVPHCHSPLAPAPWWQRIGDSLKKDTSEGTKTGRFGIGFNSGERCRRPSWVVRGRGGLRWRLRQLPSPRTPVCCFVLCPRLCLAVPRVALRAVYHLTDLPSFVSGRALVMFDPQACHLPDVDPTNPGKLMDFVAHPGMIDTYPALFAPFRAFGCDFKGPFPVRVLRV
jgi:hypothetical protein